MHFFQYLYKKWMGLPNSSDAVPSFWWNIAVFFIFLWCEMQILLANLILINLLHGCCWRNSQGSKQLSYSFHITWNPAKNCVADCLQLVFATLCYRSKKKNNCIILITETTTVKIQHSSCISVYGSRCLSQTLHHVLVHAATAYSSALS